MAQPSILTANVVSATANTVDVTIPAGANALLVFFGGYQASATLAAGATFAGNAMEQIGAGTVGSSSNNIQKFIHTSIDAGWINSTVTINIDTAADGYNSPLIVAIPIQDLDTANKYTDGTVITTANVLQYLATETTTVDDLVIAGASHYSGTLDIPTDIEVASASSTPTMNIVSAQGLSGTTNVGFTTSSTSGAFNAVVLHGIPSVVDTTPPDLTAPTATGITSDSVTLGATTSEGNGIAHAIIVPAAEEATPTNAEVIAGTYVNTLFTAVDLTISAIGAFNFAALSGLSPTTTYGYAIVHVDAAGNEDVGSRVNGTFTTTALASFTTDILVNNTGTVLASTAVAWNWFPSGVIGSLALVTPQDGTGTTAADGTLTIAEVADSITAGAGLLLITDTATGNLVYFEAGTVQ